MRLDISLFLLITCLFSITISANTSARQKTISQKAAGFSVRSYQEESANDDDDEEYYDGQAQTPHQYRSRFDYEEQPQQQQAAYQTRKPQQKQFTTKDKQKQLEEELEPEEPDRLAILLEKSQFTCDQKTTGYYADDSLGCEVFHYCQENQKHSWVCPEGFTFHQVHLICMPPSGENICEQSAKYHIVNEYLYKPINLQEHQTKPNVTLKYSERYYPENFYEDERYEADDRISHRQPVQVGFNQQRKATAAPSTAAPLPYRFGSQVHQQHVQQQQQQQQQQNVYRSPEEINISLQQRRPSQFYLATSSTPRYVEDDYSSYERK